MALRRFASMLCLNKEAFVNRTIFGTCGGVLSGAAIAIKESHDSQNEYFFDETCKSMFFVSLCGLTGFMVMALHPLPLIGVSCTAIGIGCSKFKDKF